MSKLELNRRTVIQGVGTAMALPLLEIMETSHAEAAGSGKTAPTRMAFVFFPNGAIQPNWNVKEDGEKLHLSRTLMKLDRHKNEINVFTGLAQHHGRANGDGAGDHARCAASFLTGAQPRKTSGANIQVGVSVDQAAAKVIGEQTRLPSLELGIDRGRNAGNCDSGYSCAYSSNISWKTPSQPMAKEINPKHAFERLFGNNQVAEAERRKRDLYRKSILDLVAGDAQRLKKTLGKTDRSKIDEYFTSVREIEQRIAKASAERPEIPEFTKPTGIPSEHKEHIRLMYDLMVLAFQSDSTRVSTFMLANAGDNRAYREVDVKQGWHSLSHHGNDKNKMEDLTKIDVYLAEQFAYFLDKLKAVKEGDRTLLDNSMILYGSGIADANRHSHHDLPIVVAGKGGGTMKTGRHLVFPKDTPMNNLFLSMCDRVGAKLDGIGDSTGRLGRLDG
ncbi:MAG: DUF1552 domain-containing protein [Planctomycetota bacterium]|nr:DUF1552 domain-containing protein [Planctomycetota bacterium]